MMQTLIKHKSLCYEFELFSVMYALPINNKKVQNIATKQ